MEFQLATESDTQVTAGYVCSCGCKPRLAYDRGAGVQMDVCCCGAQLALGTDASSRLELGEGGQAKIEEFESPWGETLEVAWAPGGQGQEHAHSH